MGILDWLTERHDVKQDEQGNYYANGKLSWDMTHYGCQCPNGTPAVYRNFIGWCCAGCGR
jgi:hypothetical protein